MAGDYIKVKVLGQAELRERLLGKEHEFIEEMKRIVPQEAGDLGQAANALAPVGIHEMNVEGDGKRVRVKQHLRDTLRITIDGRRPHSVLANVAYTAKHAAAVHEGLHWGRHFQTRGMKWFEKALMATGDGFIERVRARLAALVSR